MYKGESSEMQELEYRTLITKENAEDIKFMKEHTVKLGEKRLCKQTGASIEAITIGWSVHDGWSRLGSHSGGGEVIRQYRPYCPACQTPKYSEVQRCMDI